MKYLVPILKSLGLAYAGWLLWFYAFWYVPVAPGYSPPFVVFIVDTVTLIVHEAGHFVFSPFGHLLYFMGGSIFQVIFPLGIAVFLCFRYRPHAWTMLYWTGVSMCNAAVYIQDAKYQNLQLISKTVLHDWHTIMSELDALDSAVELAAWIHWLGILTAFGALVYGLVYVVTDFRERALEW